MLRKTAASGRDGRQNAKDEEETKATKATRRRAVRLFAHDGLGVMELLPGRLVGATRPRNDDASPVGERRTLYKSAVDGRVGIAALPGDAAGVGP